MHRGKKAECTWRYQHVDVGVQLDIGAEHHVHSAFFPRCDRSLGRRPAGEQPAVGEGAPDAFDRDVDVDAMREAGYARNIDQSASRAGKHPGTHEIGFDSAADTITLRHTARSREGFARGALKAAQWIAGKKGFYEFRDVLFGGTDVGLGR